MQNPNKKEKEANIAEIGKLKKIESFKEPISPNSMNCIASSVPPIECCGVWSFYVSDGNESILVISAKRIEAPEIVRDILSVKCASTPKLHCGCEIKDHYCICKRCVQSNETDKVSLTYTIITRSALRKLKNSKNVFCFAKVREFLEK